MEHAGNKLKKNTLPPYYYSKYNTAYQPASSPTPMTPPAKTTYITKSQTKHDIV